MRAVAELLSLAVIGAAPLGIAPNAHAAAGEVSINSSVFVERSVAGADGRRRILLESPRNVSRGDRLVFVLNYRNAGERNRTAFTITNPLPDPVQFEDGEDPGATVSVDGGRSWGALAALTLRDRSGRIRAARPEDVTHLRWHRALPAGEAGSVTFRGVVR